MKKLIQNQTFQNLRQLHSAITKLTPSYEEVENMIGTLAALDYELYTLFKPFFSQSRQIEITSRDIIDAMSHIQLHNYDENEADTRYGALVQQATQIIETSDENLSRFKGYADLLTNPTEEVEDEAQKLNERAHKVEEGYENISDDVDACIQEHPSSQVFMDNFQYEHALATDTALKCQDLCDNALVYMQDLYSYTKRIVDLNEKVSILEKQLQIYNNNLDYYNFDPDFSFLPKDE